MKKRPRAWRVADADGHMLDAMAAPRQISFLTTIAMHTTVVGLSTCPLITSAIRTTRAGRQSFAGAR